MYLLRFLLMPPPRKSGAGYVLRNQLVHGGSTWNSGVNSAQVRDGAEILGFLMPLFIDIMMDNPKGCNALAVCKSTDPATALLGGPQFVRIEF
jgi:hypothetical protein